MVESSASSGRRTFQKLANPCNPMSEFRSAFVESPVMRPPLTQTTSGVLVLFNKILVGREWQYGDREAIRHRPRPRFYSLLSSLGRS